MTEALIGLAGVVVGAVVTTGLAWWRERQLARFTAEQALFRMLDRLCKIALVRMNLDAEADDGASRARLSKALGDEIYHLGGDGDRCMEAVGNPLARRRRDGRLRDNDPLFSGVRGILVNHDVGDIDDLVALVRTRLARF